MCGPQGNVRVKLSAITTWASLTGKRDVLEMIVASNLRTSGGGYPWQRRGEAEARRRRALHLFK